jgi:uncharacterized phage-associated protein
MGKIIFLNKGDNHMGEYSVFEIALWFLSKESMTHKKLQKICYYAYAWYYTLYDRMLFDGNFEAWIHGPVHRELYGEYKQFGWQNIPENDINIETDEETEMFLSVIYDTFGEHTADELEEMTHEEDPWIEARRNLSPYEVGTKNISLETIKTYYSKLKDNNQVE